MRPDVEVSYSRSVPGPFGCAMQMTAAKGGASPMELDSPLGRTVVCPSREGSRRRRLLLQVAEMTAAKAGTSPMDASFMELGNPLGRAVVSTICGSCSIWCVQQQAGEMATAKKGARPMELDSSSVRAGGCPS